MLDKSRNVFFAHVPKTGGTSIEFAHGFVIGPGQTCPYRHTREKDVEEEDRAAIRHRFTIARNTYDRILSTYIHLVRSMVQKGISHYRSFDSYLEAIEAFHLGTTFFWNGTLAYNSEEEIDTKPALFDQRHIQKMSWWLCDVEDEYTILKFDNLSDDYLRRVSKKTGVQSIPHVNRTPPDLVQSLSVKTTNQHQRKISRIFGDEIEKYGFLAP